MLGRLLSNYIPIKGVQDIVVSFVTFHGQTVASHDRCAGSVSACPDGGYAFTTLPGISVFLKGQGRDILHGWLLDDLCFLETRLVCVSRYNFIMTVFDVNGAMPKTVYHPGFGLRYSLDETPRNVASMVHFANDKFFSFGGTYVCLWDAITCEKLMEVEEHEKVTCVVALPDGFACASGDFVRVWGIDGKLKLSIPIDLPVSELAFFADKIAASFVHETRVWNVHTGELVTTVDRYPSAIATFNEKFIVARDYTVTFFDSDLERETTVVLPVLVSKMVPLTDGCLAVVVEPNKLCIFR